MNNLMIVLPMIGAGHGGRGGKGNVEKLTGAAFGNIFEPSNFGCQGGGSAGGRGGGKMRLEVSGTMKIDGEVSANGGDAATGTGSGGGSGGSIWISVEHMQVWGRLFSYIICHFVCFGI